MDSAGVAQSSFAQGGYLAAKNFIQILETIEGDTIDAAAFTAAAKGMTTPDENGMRGNPWIFGEGDTHQANASSWNLTIEPGSGVWTSNGPWLTAEEIGFKPLAVAQ